VVIVAESVELPLEVLGAALRWDNAGEPHTTLAQTAVWRDEQGWREVDARAQAVLAERGLVVSGGPRPEFRAAVRVLGRPEVECYGWITTPEGERGVLAAAARGDAVLAVRDRTQDRVRLDSIRPEGLAEALVAQLPAVPAGHGRSLNVPEAAMEDRPTGRRPGRGEDDGWDGLAGPSSRERHPDAVGLRELLNLPRTGAGQLYVARRDALGRRRRAEQPVTYLDTANGRWLVQLRRNPTGENWIIAAPATPQLLISRLHEAHQSFTP
jgi:hypothetical protein